MIYLASPYSGGSAEQMEQRFDAVCRFAGKLMQLGLVVYSPIAHCHPIAVRIELPRTWEFWEKFDSEMIRRANQLWVLKLPGWEQSKGVAAEIKIAAGLNIPVRYLEPTEFPA